MLGGTSVRVNAESVIDTPFLRIRRPTLGLLQSSTPCNPADAAHNSAAHRRCGLFPYTPDLSKKPVVVDFPVLLTHPLPADMTEQL
jgi:hypothetical protein